MLYFGLSWARSCGHGQWARFQNFRNDGNLMRLSIAGPVGERDPFATTERVVQR
jgi:hypothetical protein